MLVLYTSEPNTFFLKPLIALAEKGVSFFAPGFPTDLESSLQLEREGPPAVHDGTRPQPKVVTPGRCWAVRSIWPAHPERHCIPGIEASRWG